MDKNILLHWLEERYSSIRIIRERVYSITIWSLWLLLWLSWAIIQIDRKFTFYNKIFFIIVVSISWFLLYAFYLKDLEKWFKTQKNIAGKIEEELWFFKERDFIFFKKDSIYPQNWRKSNEWNFFRNSYIIIWFWYIVLLLSIILFI